MSFLSRLFCRSKVTIEQPDDTGLKEQLSKVVREHKKANAALQKVVRKQQSDGEFARKVISDMLDRTRLAAKDTTGGQQ